MLTRCAGGLGANDDVMCSFDGKLADNVSFILGFRSWRARYTSLQKKSLLNKQRWTHDKQQVLNVVGSASFAVSSVFVGLAESAGASAVGSLRACTHSRACSNSCKRWCRLQGHPTSGPIRGRVRTTRCAPRSKEAPSNSVAAVAATCGHCQANTTAPVVC